MLCMQGLAGLAVGHVLTRLYLQRNGEARKSDKEVAYALCIQLHEQALLLLKCIMQPHESPILAAQHAWSVGKFTFQIIGALPPICTLQGADNVEKLCSYIAHDEAFSDDETVKQMLAAKYTREPADVPLQIPLKLADAARFTIRLNGFTNRVSDPRRADPTFLLHSAAELVQCSLDCVKHFLSLVLPTMTEKDFMLDCVHLNNKFVEDRQMWNAWSHYYPISE